MIVFLSFPIPSVSLFHALLGAAVFIE